jgi:hypothetical protein
MIWQKRVASLLLFTSILTTSACGTLLHPERSGQRGERIDPAVALLDGIGVLFYVIPGLVAFAIDFSNGTIYLPGGRRMSVASTDEHRTVAEGAISKESVAVIIERELAVPDVFNDKRLMVSPLR